MKNKTLDINKIREILSNDNMYQHSELHSYELDMMKNYIIIQ